MLKERSRERHPILGIVIIAVIVAIVYFFFFYRNADSVEVVAYPDVSQYTVYDGRQAYEYWRTTLNENQQILYEEMKEAYLQFLDSFSTKSKSMTEDEFQEVYSAVLLDHPEIFWMNSYQVIVKPFSDKVNTNKKIKLFYHYSEAEAKQVKERIEPEINKLVEEASKLNTDFEKILYVHDTIITNTEYIDSDNRKSYQTLVSIFDEHKSVCAGYTYGFKLVMDRLGIKTVSVRDIGNKDSDENHIWNMVYLYEKWYNIDLTWDDTRYKDSEIIYNNFLKDNETFYKTHRMQKNMPGMESE
jgi:hypothetical protein